MTLRQFFGQKPVILTLVYYQCPMLCTEVLNGLLRSAKELPLEIGKDFNVVTVSIDPSERPVLADVKHQLYTGLYGRPGGPQGWHFLTGDEPQIKALAEAVGFRYAYDSASGQFAHPSGIMLLTPEGKLTRYFYGIAYPSRDLRLALVEASQGKIGSPIDQILLYCYHYDPQTGQYGLLISHVIQAAAGLTVLLLGMVIAILFRRENYGRREMLGRGNGKRRWKAPSERPALQRRAVPGAMAASAPAGRLRRSPSAWTTCFSFSPASPCFSPFSSSQPSSTS